ncbi:MAG: hypothetical protein ACLU2U_05965 [Bifidobacterium angulatum]|jgi:hypothetical protein
MSDENNVDENYVSDSKEIVAPPDRKPIKIAAVLLEISNQDDKKWLLDNIIGFNRNVEQKTSILFAVIGVFAGFIISSDSFTNAVGTLVANPYAHALPVVFLALSAITLIVSLGLFASIMMARLKSNGDSILYFGSIASKTAEQYGAALDAGIDPDDFSKQIHINACICKKKFDLYNKCVVAVIAAIAFCILFLIAMQMGA